MIKKIVLCVVMLLFTMSTVTNAGRPKTKKQDKEALYEARHEIDNYDFLYNDSDFDYGYDATATENLMDEAFAHLGTRYRRGAKGPSAFDCSGFTSYVYSKMMNKSIGASSRDQYARNTPIRNDELQTGDLVFFTTYSGTLEQRKYHTGHVGVYVGNGLMVDANTTGVLTRQVARASFVGGGTPITLIS
jgi:cell wall-associated NlpC family hydrolase